MRAPICIGALCLLITGSVAFAQSGAESATTGASERLVSRTTLDEQARFAQCMKDWDAKTHMTTQEWERTCRRVMDERIKYLREHGSAAEGKKSQARSK